MPPTTPPNGTAEPQIRRYVIAVDEVAWDLPGSGVTRIATLAVAIPEGWLAYRIPRALIAGFDAGGPQSKSARLHGRDCVDSQAVVAAMGSELFSHANLRVDPNEMMVVGVRWEPKPSSANVHSSLRMLQLQIAAAIQAFRHLRSRFDSSCKLEVEIRLGQFSFLEPHLADIIESLVHENLGDESNQIRRLSVVRGDDPALMTADLLLHVLYTRWPKTELPNGFPKAVMGEAAADTNKYLPPRALARLLAELRPVCFGDPEVNGLIGALADELDQHDKPATAVRNLLDAIDRALVASPTRSPGGLRRAIGWCNVLDSARQRTSDHRSWNSADGFEARFMLLDIPLRAYNHAGRSLEPEAVQLVDALDDFCKSQTPPNLSGLETVLGRFARLGEHLHDQFAFKDALKLIRQAETRYRPFAQYVQRQFGITMRPIGTMASQRARLLAALAASSSDPTEITKYRQEAEETLKNDVPMWFTDPADEARRHANLGHLYADMNRPLDAISEWLAAVGLKLPAFRRVAFTNAGELAAALAREWPSHGHHTVETLSRWQWEIWLLARILAIDPRIPDPNSPGQTISLRTECGNWLLDMLSVWLNERGNGGAQHPWPSVMRDAVAVAKAIPLQWNEIALAQIYACRPNPKTPLNQLEAAAIAASFALSNNDTARLESALSDAEIAISHFPHAHHVFESVTDTHRPMDERGAELVRRFPRH